MNKTKIELGQRVKDIVSEAVGIATARVTYLNGCEQLLISPKVDDKGTIPKGVWIDEVQLEVVDNGILPEKEKIPGIKRVTKVSPRHGGEREHPN